MILWWLGISNLVLFLWSTPVEGHLWGFGSCPCLRSKQETRQSPSSSGARFCTGNSESKCKFVLFQEGAPLCRFSHEGVYGGAWSRFPLWNPGSPPLQQGEGSITHRLRQCACSGPSDVVYLVMVYQGGSLLFSGVYSPDYDNCSNVQYVNKQPRRPGKGDFGSGRDLNHWPPPLPMIPHQVETQLIASQQFPVSVSGLIRL